MILTVRHAIAATITLLIMKHWALSTPAVILLHSSTASPEDTEGGSGESKLSNIAFGLAFFKILIMYKVLNNTDLNRLANGGIHLV